MKQVIFLSLIILIVSCEKDSQQGFFSKDTYAGLFEADYHLNKTIWNDTIVFMVNGDYFEYNGNNELIYGSGKFVEHTDTIVFLDENARPELYTWDWILNGKFKAENRGDTLVFTKQEHQNVFRYTLW